jgi:hypothetical protein
MVNTNNSTPQPHTAAVSPQQSSTVATSMTSPNQIPSPSQSSPFPVTVIAQHGNNPSPEFGFWILDNRNANLFNV